MRHILLQTGDGSHTVLDRELNVTFHSKYGALQESQHVFIQEGLEKLPPGIDPILILETGFGTGLNAYLTLLHANRHRRRTHYQAYDLFPLEKELYSQLNYPDLIKRSSSDFLSLHDAEWEKSVKFSRFFTLKKIKCDFRDISGDTAFDLIFLDAFAPSAQAEFWEKPFISRLHAILKPGGLIITYCAKGSFKRALQAAGFQIESPQGPAGKREITRALKSK